MIRDIWPTLWASEFEPAELAVGSLIAFTKTSRRAGDYGLADALIAGLDRIPLTHIGIVTVAGSRPELVHSTLAGLRCDPLESAAAPHRHGPIFAFTHASASPDTLSAVAAEAVRRTSAQPNMSQQYPSHDLLIAAVLLRVRNGERFDEHAHRRLASLFTRVLPSNSASRMCAAFIADVFDSIGAPFAGPNERAAHERDLIDAYALRWILPPSTLGPIGAALADLAAHLLAIVPRMSGGAESAALTQILNPVANDVPTATSLARWLIAPTADTTEDHPSVVRLIEVVDGATETLTAALTHLPARFTTVNDLIRSPDLTPFGHGIDWWATPHTIPTAT